jgi:uncharacterized protein (TIGR02118 family)
MSKVIFVLHKRQDITLDEFFQHWSGERHVSIVKRVPGLKRWVQNRSLPDPSQGEPVCDGIGELWFESAEAMRSAFQSKEFGAAMEDARQFVDLERTRMLSVEEARVI